MCTDRKYRVCFIKDFVNAEAEDVKYIYFQTKQDAIDTMKKMAAQGKYQSEQGGHKSGLPHVAALEYWDEDEMDWLFV